MRGNPPAVLGACRWRWRVASGAVGNLTGSAKVMTWKDGEKTITVTFVNDKVALKAQRGL